jgi:4-amino-4-deoxy-L-arabinose transferase-like glycosyltransferase
MTSEAILDRTTDATERAPRTLDSLTRPEGRTFARGLVLITVIAAVVRVLNVLWWRPSTTGPSSRGFTVGGDSFFYHWQADALAKGHWFVDPFQWANQGLTAPSSAHPPLYPLYLSLWSRVGIGSLTGHRLASCLLGVATVVVIALLAYRLAGTAAGLVAAGLAALYPQLWINDGMLMSESLVVLLSALVLYAAYCFIASPRVRSAVLLGLACGAATLTRSELLLLFPFLVVPLACFVKNKGWKQRAKLAIVACVTGGVLILPWVTFNMVRFDEPTWLSTGTGSALSAASCDATYYGSKIGYWEYCFQGPYPPVTLDESVRDLAPRHAADKYISAHLSRLPLVMAARIGRMWGVFKPGQTTTFEWSLEARGRTASWIALFFYYALLPFAIVGLVVMRRRKIAIWPVIVFAVIATIAAATTFGVTRYRAPAEVGLVLAAAIGIVAVCRRFAGRFTTAPVGSRVP